MAELLAPQPLKDRIEAAHVRLAVAVARHGRLTYSNSLGAEAMVLTDIIWQHFPQIEVFTIDTGRLPEETYNLVDRLQRRYARTLRVVYPDARDLERLVAAQGMNGFYDSLEQRLSCCGVRKVEPFRRAVAGFDGWVTGVRREQSAGRAAAQAEEWDGEYGLWKVSPIIDWSEAEVWQYIRGRGLPYNALHDRQYPSIGCSPCTRAIQPGESRRAGRWWWEQPETRECGLHPRNRAPALVAVAS